MTRYVRPAVAGMEAYVPGEQPQGGGWVKLNTNENPYPPSPRVLEALRAAVGDDLRLYPDPVGKALRQRAASVYGIDPSGILVGNGSDELLGLIVRAIVGPGDTVVYPTPTYSLYDTLVAEQGGNVRAVPYGDDFALPQGIEGAEAKLTFLCHPNSPSGVPLPLERIRRVAEASPGVVVVDEAYVDFGGETAMPLARELGNVIVLRTFSKSFSLAGMRIGLAFGAPALLAEIGKIKDSYNIDRLSLVAAEAALADYAWMQANVARVCATRDRLVEALRQRRFVVLDSATNFVLARRPGEDLQGLYLALKERRVLVRHFATPRLRDGLRITVGTDAETDALLAALDQIEK